MRYVRVFVILILNVLQSFGELPPSSCHLPSGPAGLCVPISDCAHLTALIANLQKPLPQEVSLFIKNSFFCGYNAHQTISVCCPVDGLKSPTVNAPRMAPQEECGLQNGQPAECVPLSKCTPFRMMMVNLRKPLPPEVPSILKSSYLCGVEQVGGRKEHKVCCPPAIITSTPTTTTLKSQKVVPTSATRMSTVSSENLLSEDKFDSIEARNDVMDEKTKQSYETHPGRPYLSNSTSCGLSKLVPGGRGEKTFGGKSAKLGQFPWLVNLGYTQDGRNGTVYKCGGTLIGAQYVLTAAHCVKNLPGGFNLSKVWAGEHNLATERDCNIHGTVCSDSPQNMEIEKVIIHENFGKPTTFQNDIALLKLRQSVNMNDFVSPICLPFDGRKDQDDISQDSDDQVMVVTGWGGTTRNDMILQYVEMKEFSFEECRHIYNETGITLNQTVLCAGGRVGEDSCLGDSGSGLMRGGAENYQLVGLVSIRPKLCGTEPGVYTKVESYMDWILDRVYELEETVTISAQDDLDTERMERQHESSSESYLNHPARHLLSNDSTCGIAYATLSCVKMRIVGGNDAELGQYPWLVNLGYSSGRKPGTMYKCGGTLIGARYVLTAAHCVTQLPRGFGLTTIRVGEHDLDSDTDCNEECELCSDKPQNIDVEKVVFHPSYGKPQPFQNDIAVIKLSRDVEENDFVNPVCIPFHDDDEDYSTNTVAGESVLTTVAGWGATTGTGRSPATVLQYLGVNVTNSKECQDIYRKRGGQLTDMQICAGGAPGKDSCVGDSGSGLMRELMEEFFPRSYLIGVVSFGPRLCGTRGVPGVYTRVNSYLGWVLDTVREMDRK